MDIKQEDLIRFWTWCGFNIKYTKGQGVWYGMPQSKHRDFVGFPIMDLDIIYQYAIPKLQKEGYSITLIAFECSGFSARIISVAGHLIGVQEIAHERADSPTEALYNAILKVIDNEVK